MSETHDCYDFEIGAGEFSLIIDWQTMVEQLLLDKLTESTNYCAAKFHNTLAKISGDIVHRANQKNIVLSGGCFQNAILTKKVFANIKAENFTLYTHQNVPPNDGGLALGQLHAAFFLS
jgi:hydrogenase maturation protein HypF